MKNRYREKPVSRFLPGGLLPEDILGRANRKVPLSRAVFLDRDGTINIDRGYIINPDKIEINSADGGAIQLLNELNIPTIIITNQAAIDKRLLGLEDFEKVNDKLWDTLKTMGAHYDALYFCPHSPDVTPGCHCRKPEPGLILQAAMDFNVDLKSSFMIGDKLTDIAAGHLSKCRTILLLGESSVADFENDERFSKFPPDYVCKNLREAVDWLLSNIYQS